MSAKPSWTKCVPQAVPRTARARRLMRPSISQARRPKQSSGPLRQRARRMSIAKIMAWVTSRAGTAKVGM